MVDTTAAAFGMQPVTSRGRNVPRRRDVEEQTEEAFAAEEQRLERFSLPMGADPDKDELAGVDELGNKVYISPLGVRYTIKTTTPQPKEWETEPATMARVGEVAKKYATGAVEGLTSAVTAPGRALAGEPVTTGEVLDTAGFAATGAIPGIARGAIEGVDPNVASVFAGLTGYSNYTGKPMRGMVDAYDTYAKNLARLKKEAQDNNTFVPEETLKYQASEDTWNQTGFFIGQDGDVRFEIDDSKATITPTKLTEINGHQYARDLIDRNKKTTTLQDFLKHDDLFKAYPQLKDLPVFVDNSLAGTNTRGWFDPAKGKNSIALSPDIIGNDYVLNKVGMSTLLHEIQHYIQDIEGFDQGTNLTNPEIVKIYSAETKGIRGKEIQDQYLKDKAAFDAYYTGHKAKVDSDIVDFYTTLLQDKYGVDPSKAIEKFETSQKRVDDRAKLYDALGSLKEKSLLSFFSKSKVPSELTSSLAAFLVGDLNANSLVTTAVQRHPQDFNDFFSTNLSANDLIDKTGRYRSPNIGYDVFLPDNIKLPEKPLFIDPSQPFSQSIAQNIYERRSGEAESRNVPARKDFTPEKRAATFPRVTEDVLPQYQWTGSEVKRYAQGGTVIPNTETQMNRLMQEGGIADDGMRRDPVSGNEVPPGSMAEEVRDDIPAQLSSGEYVVPADVLRYYGVAFFEKLRAEAKRGLSEMEAGGRIGGEPVEMEDDDEGELPFDISELETSGGDDADMQMAAMGMAQGGVVKMQEGGAMTQPATSTFNPAQYQTVGGSYFQTGAAPTHEYKVYQNAQGQIISILFINGVAQQPIPEGYFPQGEAPKVQQPTATDSGDDRDETPQQPTKSFNEYTAEDWMNYKPDTGVGSTIGKIAGGFIGGALLGPAGAMLGAKGAEEAMARNSVSAYNALNDFVGGMNKADPNYSAFADKRNKMYGDLTAAQNENPGFFGNLFNNVFGKPEIAAPKTGQGAAARAAATAAAPAAAPARERDRAEPATATGAAAAPAAGGRGTGATATATGRPSGVSVRNVTALEGPEAASVTQRKAEDQKLGAGARGAAQGGLMVKARVAKKTAKKRPIKTTDA